MGDLMELLEIDGLSLSEEDKETLSKYGSGLKWVCKALWDRYPTTSIERLQFFIERFAAYMRDYPDMNISADFDIIVQSILTSTELLFDKTPDDTDDNVKLRRELRSAQRTLSASRSERHKMGAELVRRMIDVSRLKDVSVDEYRKLYLDAQKDDDDESVKEIGSGQLEQEAEVEAIDRPG